jgi:hypothetical protein
LASLRGCQLPFNPAGVLLERIVEGLAGSVPSFLADPNLHGNCLFVVLNAE